MKYSLIALTLAAAASAQSVTACDGKAQKCIDDASAGICDLGDWACGCTEANMGKIQAGATTCVITACGGATGALAVISEVQAICEEVLANPPATEEPEPTKGTEEPEPTKGTEEPEPTEGTEEPEPTEGTEEPEPTESTGPCKKCNGTTPEQPKPTGDDEEPPVQAGAGALAPIAALALGLFAFAL